MRAKELFSKAEDLPENDPKRLELLRAAVELDPDSVRYRYHLARAYYYNQQYENVVKECGEILKRDPRHADALTVMGSAYLLLDQYQKAIDAHEAALKIDPTNIYAQFNLAFACWQANDKERARREWQKYIDMAGDNPSQKKFVEIAKQYLKQLQ